MFTIVVIFHVIVCIGLVLVVLMQSSKGEGLAGSSFGGSTSSAVFGGRGAASFLSKATTVLAVVFMVNSISLAFMSAGAQNAGAGGATGGTDQTSVITQRATAERDRALRQQQAAQRQGTAGGFDTTGDPSISVTLGKPEKAPDTSGGQ